MRSKAPLALMEQMVMLLVFALASALCLQAFIKSDQISMESETRSRAVLVAQNAAEMLRYSGGDMEHALLRTGKLLGGIYANEKLSIHYDQNWAVTEKEGTYCLTVEEVPVEEPGLRRALVQVVTEDSANPELLFELETAWLEVNCNE